MTKQVDDTELTLSSSSLREQVAVQVRELVLRGTGEELAQALLTLVDGLCVERDSAAADLGNAAAQLDNAAAELGRATRRAAQLEHLTEQLEQRALRLTLQVKRMAYLLYGRRSEKLSADELKQLVLAFGGSEQAAESGDPSVPVPNVPQEPAGEAQTEQDTGKQPQKRPNHRGRTKLSANIERLVTDVPVDAAERCCVQCGSEMLCIGHLEHERIEYVPPKLIAHIERREKLGCKACRGDAITAARQDVPAVARRVGASLLAHLIESKCDDALPIYRQRDQLLRLGFDVPLNTLYGYWSYGTDLISSVGNTTLSSLLGDSIVNLDDTRLDVLDRDDPRGKYRGHLWCFTGTRPLVAYAFTETWKADDIAPWIGAIDGFIQCDDYKGYSSKLRGPDGQEYVLVPPERRLGCMMHVRRRFHAALKLGDKRATVPIELIAEIYLIEAEAKAQGLDAAGRLALRQHRSLPLLERFDQWVDAQANKLVPSSKLADGVRYALQQRPFIRRCFSDGRFEIDNGRVERAIREPAIGRRNFLFTGSADGAKRLATAYTLVQSCRALGICTREYLIDIINKLESGWPLRKIAELVPDRWAIDRGLYTPPLAP